MNEDTRTDAQKAFQRASFRQIANVGRIPRMTQDERRKFVIDFLASRIFTSAQLRDHDQISMVFMVLALFPVFQGWEKEDIAQVGVIWEYMEAAGPRSCNGLPMFLSMRMMHREDWDRCLTAITNEQERLENIDV